MSKKPIVNDPPLDGVDRAIAAGDKEIRADAALKDGRKLSLVLPHPFTADDFESAIVILLSARAQSEARVAASKPVMIPRPTLIVPGRR